MESSPVFPASVAIESEVLGSIISDNGILDHALEAGLTLEDFSTEFNCRVFTTILDLYATGAPFDVLSVSDKLGEANIALLSALLDGAVLVPSRIVHHVGILRRKARLRFLLELAGWITRGATATFADPVEIEKHILDAMTPRATAAKAGR
jgi:replicative DNA helicase